VIRLLIGYTTKWSWILTAVLIIAGVCRVDARGPERSGAPIAEAADSSSQTDSLQPVIRLPDGVLERSRLPLRVTLADSLEMIEYPSGQLRRSGAFYIDDLLRLNPFIMSGDSLGNGYTNKFNPLGAGFDQVRYFLNGMPLTDPLTGDIDLRMIAPEILGRILVLPSGGFGGPQGGAQEVHLVTKQADLPTARSRMGIFGGAYQINKVGGGLRRRLFGSAALHVDINKIEQRTENLDFKVEQVQYFTHLEKKIWGAALFTADGLFFSNNRKAGNYGNKLKRKNTHLQLALTGGMGETVGYRLGYRYASSRHPYISNGNTFHLEGRADGYQAHFLFNPGKNLSLGIDLQGEKNRQVNNPDSLETERSLTTHSQIGFVRFRAPGGLVLRSSAGVRRYSGGTGGEPVFDLGVRKKFSDTMTGCLSWKKDVSFPGLASLQSYSNFDSDRTGYKPGRLESLEGGLQIQLAGDRVLHAGMTRRQVRGQAVAAYNPNPLVVLEYKTIDYTVNGFYYRFQGRVWSILNLRAEGLELFDLPDDIGYLPRRRHTATLGFDKDFRQGDFELGLQAEMIYEGEFFFPLAEDQTAGFASQPGRVNFGGSGMMRIVDLTIYCRLDHLMSEYYNGLDPVSLPGPRAVFGLNWEFSN
jgi:TonB-dependent Receptor Plug Domain